ncbi:MAG: type IV secretory system conjugative DNA transfer family protein [Clostridiales bacterium]|nr:type IV secretory system conjugative DNA transfer family protein [Clostridiales bacterium]
MQGNVVPLVATAVIMFLLLGGFTLFSQWFNLNRIKDKTVGNGQHGTARWATKREIADTYKAVPFTPALWRKGKNMPKEQGVIVGCTGTKDNVTALVDTADVHALMIAGSGAGKTTFWLYPCLEYAMATGTSFLSTDTKGDVVRNYGTIAAKYYDYNVSVIDLRNPTKSNGNNLLQLVNKYMDSYKDTCALADKAKAEKYAKTISKTIILMGTDASAFGQNTFFYDAAEGLITATILLVAEFCAPEERHIVTVFKIIQELLAPAPDGKNQFQLLMDRLPADHKAKWFSAAALNSSANSMASVITTALSRLNTFLDSEMEQILCFDRPFDAEMFCREKCALFLIMPEENPNTYFLISLLIQQMYREILTVADEQGGKLKKRCVFYCDEFGTLPKIESADMMFSAARSRGLQIVPIIQSFAQLEKNYGDKGTEIIVDNTQVILCGGFAPNSSSADIISKALGSRTALSGSVTRGRADPSESLQMIGRELMTAEELKSLPQGSFVVLKTGKHPMRVKLRFFSKWGIKFDAVPYSVPEHADRPINYGSKDKLQAKIYEKYPPPTRAAAFSAPGSSNSGMYQVPPPDRPIRGINSMHM